MLKSCLQQAKSVARITTHYNYRLAHTIMSSDNEVVKDNIQHILKQIDENVAESTRTKRCRLVAVSKTKAASLIQACYDIGQRNFGENYVQELEEKSAQLAESCTEIKWHYIGQIQSNKIPKIASSSGLYCVETLESEKHCGLFEKEMAKHQKTVKVLIQVNTSSEEQKGGLKPQEALKLAAYVKENCPHLQLKGFMTIGSFENSHMVPNPDFDVLYNVRKQWAAQSGENEEELELSMGMSEDFPTAIQQGSTSVRVGSKIFGPRLYKK